MIPLLFGTVLLISLVSVLIPESFFTSVFSGNLLIDPLIGDVIGSISTGNPVTSYIFGGELLKHGVSLLAVTAFLVSWVTVGLVQLPFEAATLGKKFALLRNLSAFFLSILVALLTVFLWGII